MESIFHIRTLSELRLALPENSLRMYSRWSRLQLKDILQQCRGNTVIIQSRRYASTAPGPSRNEWKKLDTHRIILIVMPVILAGAVSYFTITNLPPSLKPFLPRTFTPANVHSITPAGLDTALVSLSLPREMVGPPPGSVPPIWSIYVKDSDMQIERPYTPLSGGVDSQGRFDLWVKSYENGEVGRWLCSRKVGDIVEVRGPVVTWKWEDDKYDEVIMLSGGTGITPFIQLFNTVISSSLPPSSASSASALKYLSPHTRFTLLHGSSSPAHLPPPSILEPLRMYAEQHPDRFRLQIFVENARGRKNSDMKVGRIGKKEVLNVLHTMEPHKAGFLDWLMPSNSQEKSGRMTKRVLFLVCGPESLIEALAGPRGRDLAQGPVGGVLGELGYTEKDVWKL